MKMVFLEDVTGVALGGEVKDVKNGFARNYLIPKRLAVPASRQSLQRVKRLKVEAEDTRLKRLEDLRALGEELDGSMLNVAMRAGASGRLYGSVTNVIVAERLSELTEREIDRRTVEIPEPIRQVGRHDVQVRLHTEVDATVTLLVHPEDTDADEFLASLDAAEEQEPAAPEQTDAQAEEQEPVAPEQADAQAEDNENGQGPPEAE